MSDFSSVAPPQTNLNQSQAFAAALQRAKQIAAKIHTTPQQPTVGAKRPFEDDNGPDPKKFSSPDSYSNNSVSSQQTNMSQAMAQAAAVAARLAATGGSTVEEQIRYPESIVSQMVGRNSNENLSHIQAETGCKIILSKESERCCTLRGSREAVTKGKEMIQKLANQHGGGVVEVVVSLSMPQPGPGGYPPFQEIMVPGPKVGLVIGKGGETIKMLQEKTGAKMVIIQDGPNQEVEKPLRISGDPQKIEHAKSLVFDLIRDKEQLHSGGAGGGGGSNNFNNIPGGEQAEVFVPKTAVGVVIGKGGEMIKKIQGETGCRLQFVQGKNDEPGDRRCIIQGTNQQVEDGKRMIEGLIESVMRSNQQGNNRNNNGQGDNANSNYGYGYGVNHTQQPSREEVTFSVPAAKCGIVIGRGGETIKLINQQSGAYCEMDRSAVNPPSEKMFKAKGTAEQIENARHMISEKINIDIVIQTRKPIGNAPNHQNSYNNNMQNDPNAVYQQQQQQQWGGYQQQGWEQSQQQVQANVAAAGQAADYSTQWIEYYKSMGMHREAEIIEQQLKSKQPQQMQPASNGAAIPQGNPAMGGQMTQAQTQDFSAQWADYYRSMGKIEEAEVIEKQLAAQKAGGGQAAGVQNPAVPSGAQQQAQQPGYAQGITANQYAQYSQYYAAAAAAGGQPGYPAQAYPGYGCYPSGPQQQQQQPAGGQPGQQQKQNMKPGDKK